MNTILQNFLPLIIYSTFLVPFVLTIKYLEKFHFVSLEAYRAKYAYINDYIPILSKYCRTIIKFFVAPLGAVKTALLFYISIMNGNSILKATTGVFVITFLTILMFSLFFPSEEN